MNNLDFRYAVFPAVHRSLVVYRKLAILLTPIIQAAVIAGLVRFLGLGEPPKFVADVKPSGLPAEFPRVEQVLHPTLFSGRGN